jgi:hypothetical protein
MKARMSLKNPIFCNLIKTKIDEEFLKTNGRRIVETHKFIRMKEKNNQSNENTWKNKLLRNGFFTIFRLLGHICEICITKRNQMRYSVIYTAPLADIEA